MGEKMMEMYKTKATKAWQALERIIQLLLWRQLLLKENENGLAGCDDGSAGGTRFCLGQFERIGLERSPEYDEVLKGWGLFL